MVLECLSYLVFLSKLPPSKVVNKTAHSHIGSYWPMVLKPGVWNVLGHFQAASYIHTASDRVMPWFFLGTSFSDQEIEDEKMCCCRWLLGVALLGF